MDKGGVTEERGNGEGMGRDSGRMRLSGRWFPPSHSPFLPLCLTPSPLSLSIPFM